MKDVLPTQSEQFDPRLHEPVLDELLENTRGQCPMVKLEVDVRSSQRALRGVANRAGLLRLGVALAKAATQNDVQVVVHGDGSVEQETGIGLIEIILTEDPWPKPRKRRELGRTGYMILALAAIITLILVGIGAFQVVEWIDHQFSG
ncbi:MAG: hypothetical protein ACJ8FY_14770 [Gemmataceae bacterium]